MIYDSPLNLTCLFPAPQLVDGEMYPPAVSEAPVHMIYPEGFPPQHQLAIGQEFYGILPGLTMYATIWLREHNRVCDVLKAEHPTWDDEQLFQTTRLIIIGEERTHGAMLRRASSDELERCWGVMTSEPRSKTQKNNSL